MSADLAPRLNSDVAAEAAQLFVINLCASTSPMALVQPSTPELKRYTFFVSRQREDGRERFRLHMGYFGSQEDAELLLSAVRDVYPAAWAGPAPTTGVPRRARMSVTPKVTVAQGAAVTASPAVVPAVAAEKPAAPAASVIAEPVSPPTLEAMSNVRDVIAQLGEETPAAKATVPAATTVAAVPAAAAAADLSDSQTLRVLELPAASSAAPAVPVVRASAPVAAAAPVAPAVAVPAAVAPAAVVPVAATVSPPAMAATPRMSPPAARTPAAPAARPTSKTRPSAPAAGEGEVRIVTPEDTQTLTDIRLDAQNNAPPCFAVQLVWAVSPIDVASLAHLAIFDAYTLYNVEGSRQGRKWFGLRLGFFSDPNSATQVAHYVRSDYPAVAVVPVATRERDHAKGGIAAAPKSVSSVAPLRPENSLSIERESLDGFELLPDDAPRAAKRDVEDIASPQQVAAAPTVQGAASMTAREKIAAAAAGRPLANAAAPAGQSTAGKATGRPMGKRVMVRKHPQPPASSRAAPGAPNPLESTLEILGASTLTLDESREIVNDSAIRRPIEKKQGSRFSKLLSRLSGG